MLGFSLPISVAMDNLLLAVVLFSLVHNARTIWQIATQHPVARAAWLLFGILFFAIFYGEAPLSKAVDILAKYIDLAFVPLFVLMLSNEVDRRRAQYAFFAAMGVTLLLSWLVGLKILPVQDWMWTDVTVNNPAVFHSHITHNNMMAFAVFLALLNLRGTVSSSARMAWGLFALMGAINVLFMVQGRTGYMILLILLGWFTWSTLARYMRKRGRLWGWRQGVAMVLVFAGVAITIYQTSSRLHERMDLVSSEYQAWQPNHGKDTSTGQRLDFYYNTLQIVQRHPIFGVGTGGFAAAFAKQTQGTAVLHTPNPHNEYLLITAQIGLVGLAFLLYLFYTLWRCAPLLNTSFEQDAARGLVLAYLINCAFNSPLLDHSDGLFFAFMVAMLFANLKLEPKHG